jgi:hypothetical protein
MRLEKCLGLTFLIFATIPAQIPVNVSAKLLSYQNDFAMGRISHHRSGLAEASEALFDEGEAITRFAAESDNPEAPSISSQFWRSPYMTEFEVSPGDGAEVKALLQADLKSAGLERFNFRASEAVAEFSTPADSSDLFPSTAPSLSESELVKLAEKHAKRHLKPFKGRIEFDNTEFSYMNGKVVNARLRYRRIFKNAIVLKDMSYIYVNVDRRGALKGVKVKWPKFKGIAGFEPALALSSIMDRAKVEVANLGEARRGTSVLKPKSASLKGMSAAWIPIVEGGKTRITPCYSFSTEVVFDSGDLDQTFVEVPMLEKYLRKLGEK